MKNAKHTPGPWVVAENLDGVYAGTMSLVTGPEGEIAGPRQLGRREDRNVEANARLIAAAPDLLGALEQAHLDIIHLLNYGNFGGSNFSTSSISCVDGLVKLNASYIVDAIAKATGGD